MATAAPQSSSARRDLFASPLFAFELANAAVLNPKLMADIEQRRANEPGMTVSNQLGWHSQRDLFKRPEESFKALNADIAVALRQVARDLCQDFATSSYDMLCEGWVNVNGKGAFNAPHDHAAFHFSGCYYVHVPQATAGRSGSIEFLDPRSLGGQAGDAALGFLFPKFRFEPKPGQLLIFPAYLRHWVYPNQEDENRVSIAFNAKLVRRNKPAKPV